MNICFETNLFDVPFLSSLGASLGTTIQVAKSRERAHANKEMRTVKKQDLLRGIVSAFLTTDLKKA